MTDSKELTALLLSPTAWDVMRAQAIALHKSQFFPQLKSPEQAVAIVMKGYEVGLPPMASLSSISIIQGAPTINAQAQMALIRKHCPNADIHFEKIADDECVINASRRKGEPKTRFSYSMKDAERAGLASKDNWKKMPRDMCRSRCQSQMARTLFPDAIMGLYTPEEINPDVSVDDEGSIQAIVVEPVKPKIEAPKVFTAADEMAFDKLLGYLKKTDLDEDLHHDVASLLEGKEFTQQNIAKAIELIKQQSS